MVNSRGKTALRRGSSIPAAGRGGKNKWVGVWGRALTDFRGAGKNLARRKGGCVLCPHLFTAPTAHPMPAWGTAPGIGTLKRFEGCKPGIIPAIRNAPDVPGLQPSGSIFAQNSGRQPYAHPIPGRWPSKTGLPRAPWGQFSLFVPFTKSDGTDPWRGKSVNRLRHPWRGKSVNAHPPPPICVHLRIIPPPPPQFLILNS